MKTNIYLPKTICIGYQERSDTYTKKLAYIIYKDEKNVLRKAASWNSWRDKKIEPNEFENEPTSGFVLNKHAGGVEHSWGWNARKSYCRVYDPRGFEFEITIENLLYILENTNSIKGKGLEGEFVYGWSGTDLVLIPCDSPDYKELKKYSEIIASNKKISAKDLKTGATYMNRAGDKFVYLGKFDYYEDVKIQEGIMIPDPFFRYREIEKYHYENKNTGKRFWFYTPGKEIGKYSFNSFKSISGKFVNCVDENCIPNYSEIMDSLECTNCNYSPIDKGKEEKRDISLNEFINTINNNIYKIYNNRYGSHFAIFSELNEKENEFKTTMSQFYTDNLISDDYYGWKISSEYIMIYSTVDVVDKNSLIEYKKQEMTVKELYEHMKPYEAIRYLANGKKYKI